MHKALQDVLDFHRATSAGIGDVRNPDPTVDMALRIRLIAEEFQELLTNLYPDPSMRGDRRIQDAAEAWLFCVEQRAKLREDFGDPPIKPDVAGCADALADLTYVTIGSNVNWGIPGAHVWDEVQKANMAKAGGPVREDGKRLKPEGWQPPNIEGVLAREAEKARACEDAVNMRLDGRVQEGKDANA